MSSHVVSRRLVLRGGLDGVGQETEDGSDPQQDGEASEELSAEFDPLRGGGGWGESVGTITNEVLRRLSISQTLQGTKECEKKSDSGVHIKHYCSATRGRSQRSQFTEITVPSLKK